MQAQLHEILVQLPQDRAELDQFHLPLCLVVVVPGTVGQVDKQGAQAGEAGQDMPEDGGFKQVFPRSE